MSNLTISSFGSAVVLKEDGSMAILTLPSLRDGVINHLLKVFDDLPDQVGLVLDRQADYVRIFGLDQAFIAKALDDPIIKCAATIDMADHRAGELPQAGCDANHDGGALSAVGDDLVLVVHRVPSRFLKRCPAILGDDGHVAL